MTKSRRTDLEEKLARAISAARKAKSRELEISGDGALDLSRLRQVPQLESLRIDCGDVSDYHALSELTNLKSLILRSDEQE